MPHRTAPTSRLGKFCRVGVLAFAGLAVLAGCASQGSIDDPLTRRTTWFDFISGGDLRRACEADKANAVGSYRFVEFRNRADQVRVYEIEPIRVASRGATLRGQVVFGKAVIDRLNLFTEPLRPWNPETGERELSRAQLARIEEDLRSRGLGTGPPVGRDLASRSYFFLVSACRRDEGFDFQVYEWPDADYRRSDFAEILHLNDPTGVAFNDLPEMEERLVNYADWSRQRAATGDSTFHHYDLTVTETGVSPGRTYKRRMK